MFNTKKMIAGSLETFYKLAAITYQLGLIAIMPSANKKKAIQYSKLTIRSRSDIIKYFSSLPYGTLEELLSSREKFHLFHRRFNYPNGPSLPFVATGLICVLVRMLTEGNCGKKEGFCLDCPGGKVKKLTAYNVRGIKFIRRIQNLIKISEIESESEAKAVFSRIAEETEGQFTDNVTKGYFRRNTNYMCDSVYHVILQQDPENLSCRTPLIFTIADSAFITSIGPILDFSRLNLPYAGHQIHLGTDYIEYVRDKILDNQYWTSEDFIIKSIVRNPFYKGYVFGGLRRWRTRWEDIRSVCCFMIGSIVSILNNKSHRCYDRFFFDKLKVLRGLSSSGASPVRIVSDDYADRINRYIVKMRDISNSSDLSNLQDFPGQNTPTYISRYFATVFSHFVKNSYNNNYKIYPKTDAGRPILITVKDGTFFINETAIVDYRCVIAYDKIRRSNDKSNGRSDDRSDNASHGYGIFNNIHASSNTGNAIALRFPEYVYAAMCSNRSGESRSYFENI